MHLRNINLIKRMTRGDKGRRVFITRINFYLHCTDTPVPLYWCVLVGKTCAVSWSTTTGTCESWAQETEISLWAAGKGTDGANIHTHTHIHTFSWHKVTSMLKRAMAGVCHPGFSTKVAWERTAAGEELWWSRGWALHKLRHTSASLQLTEHFHAHLQSPTDPMELVAPAQPHTHKQQPSTHRCFI